MTATGTALIGIKYQHVNGQFTLVCLPDPLTLYEAKKRRGFSPKEAWKSANSDRRYVENGQQKKVLDWLYSNLSS